MLKRTLTAIVLILFVAGFMLCGYFVSPIFIDLLILLFLCGAVYEMFKCLKDAGFKMFPAPIIFVLVSAYPVFYLMQHFVGGGAKQVSAGLQGLLIVFLAAAMLTLTIFTFLPTKSIKKEESDTVDSQNVDSEQAQGKTRPACEIKDLFANIFVLVYPMLFMSVAWVLSYKYSAIFSILFAIFVPVLGSDTFAYWVGSTIGGKKLCPSISPKKTVAGAIGGLVGSAILALIFWVLFEVVPSLSSGYANFVAKCGYTAFFAHSSDGWMYKSALVYLTIGLVCGVISELGDLCASKIKRAIGIKDYGKIFPGHGGFMDRIDSVMYCLVVLLVAFACVYGY